MIAVDVALFAFSGSLINIEGLFARNTHSIVTGSETVLIRLEAPLTPKSIPIGTRVTLPIEIHTPGHRQRTVIARRTQIIPHLTYTTLILRVLHTVVNSFYTSAGRSNHKSIGTTDTSSTFCGEAVGDFACFSEELVGS